MSQPMGGGRFDVVRVSAHTMHTHSAHVETRRRNRGEITRARFFGLPRVDGPVTGCVLDDWLM